MSRIRSLHPGFFTDERLVSVSMAARMLFLGLGVEADDKGIFEWKPITLKMRLFPADNFDVSSHLAELVAAGVVMSYEMAGRQYGAIRNFRKHQRPKTPNNVHPMPPEVGEYVGLLPPVSETPAHEPAPFPPKGEKPPQMEDGGGRMEDGEEEKPAGFSSAQARKRPPPRRAFVKVKTASDAAASIIEEINAYERRGIEASGPPHGETVLLLPAVRAGQR